MEGKEIKEVEEAKEFTTGRNREASEGKTKVRRTFTRHDMIGCLICQYAKWVLVLRDWAQFLLVLRPCVDAT